MASIVVVGSGEDAVTRVVGWLKSVVPEWGKLDMLSITEGEAKRVQVVVGWTR